MWLSVCMLVFNLNQIEGVSLAPVIILILLKDHLNNKPLVQYFDFFCLIS